MLSGVSIKGYFVEGSVYSDPISRMEAEKNIAMQIWGDVILIDEKHNRIGFVPLDSGRSYGAFQMGNYKADIHIRGNKNEITISIQNSNTTIQGGKVKFVSTKMVVEPKNI